MAVAGGGGGGARGAMALRAPTAVARGSGARARAGGAALESLTTCAVAYMYNGWVQEPSPACALEENLLEKPTAQVLVQSRPVVINAIRLCHGPTISLGFDAAEAAHGRIKRHRLIVKGVLCRVRKGKRVSYRSLRKICHFGHLVTS